MILDINCPITHSTLHGGIITFMAQNKKTPSRLIIGFKRVFEFRDLIGFWTQPLHKMEWIGLSVSFDYDNEWEVRFE